MRKTSPKRHHFVSSNEKAKSKIIARLVQIARKDRLSYDDLLYVCQQARRKLGLRRPKRERKLPQLLGEADLKRFFRVIQDCGDVEHEIMLKFLFFTAIRVSELVKIKVSDVDLGSCKVFIDRGKGTKDRYILFPASFRLVLKSHLQANPKKSIPLRNAPLWTLYSAADPADRTGLPCAGGNHSTGKSPSIPSSDDYLPHLTWSIGCTDPTDLRPREQKKPRNLSTPLTGCRRTGVSRGPPEGQHLIGSPQETNGGKFVPKPSLTRYDKWTRNCLWNGTTALLVFRRVNDYT